MKLTAEQLEIVYKELVTNLRLKIENKFGSLSAFSRKSGINRSSLSIVFSDNQSRDMSIEFYLRILHALEFPGAEKIDNSNPENGIPLKAYLAIDNNLIMNSITIINLNL